MQRRSFIKGVVATVVAAEGFSAYGESGFRNGLSASGGTPLALARATILASNAHNAQPWLFNVSDSRIELYADAGRNLGAADPYLREMHLSLGCALENLIIAALRMAIEALSRYFPRILRAFRTSGNRAPSRWLSWRLRGSRRANCTEPFRSAIQTEAFMIPLNFRSLHS